MALSALTALTSLSSCLSYANCAMKYRNCSIFDDFHVSYVVANHGNNAIILHKNDAMAFFKGDEQVKLEPDLPLVRGYSGSWGPGLPGDDLELRWQLAELSDCRTVLADQTSHLAEFPGVFQVKRGCRSSNVLPTIYTETIRFDEIRRSAEYHRESRRRLTWFSGRTHFLELYFDFRDGELRVIRKFDSARPINPSWR